MAYEERRTTKETGSSLGHVLVVEDDPDIREVIAQGLRQEGYRVSEVEDGETALERARVLSPNLMVLDIMLPYVDGLEVCRRLKADPLTQDIAIIVVSAKSEESDKVLGLGIGADDYLTKPFSLQELRARVKAVLRRGRLVARSSSSDPVVCDGVVIDNDRHQVKVDGLRVDFTATEMRLLFFLATHPGRVFSRSQLLSRAIKEDAFVVERNIDVHIRSIRKKLGIKRTLIETVRGVGYRFKD